MPIFIAVGWVFTISLILASGYVVLFKPELIGQFGGRVLSGFEAAR